MATIARVPQEAVCPEAFHEACSWVPVCPGTFCCFVQNVHGGVLVSIQYKPTLETAMGTGTECFPDALPTARAILTRELGCNRYHFYVAFGIGIEGFQADIDAHGLPAWNVSKLPLRLEHRTGYNSHQPDAPGETA